MVTINSIRWAVVTTSGLNRLSSSYTTYKDGKWLDFDFSTLMNDYDKNYNTPRQIQKEKTYSDMVREVVGSVKLN